MLSRSSTRIGVAETVADGTTATRAKDDESDEVVVILQWGGRAGNGGGGWGR